MTFPSPRAGWPPWGLLATVQFLTRIPIRLRSAPEMERLPVWFPVAGAVIGLLAGGVGALTAWATTPLLGAAMAVTASLMITGAFHEDGLGDIADAFGGGQTVERRLEIMKDSRHGTYGVAAITASILVRVAALAALEDPWTLLGVVVAAHVLARGAAVVLMASAPLARHDGLGADYGQSTTPRRGLTAALGAVILAGTCVGWWVAPLALGALVAITATGILAVRKIQGISGDVLGASEQVAEGLVMIVAAGLAGHHTLWWV